VDFFRLDGTEEPIVFYAKKCHHCSGSLDDERRIEPFLYPEIFM